MIEVGKVYSAEQMRELMTPEEAQRLQSQGMILQFDVQTQTYRLAHFSEANSEHITGAPKGGQGTFEPLDPIRKRTPQERVNSLMLRFIEDCKQAGTVPGLDDARISAIVGEAWKTGQSEITGEVVRQVAASLLQRAENEKLAADYKKTVTPSPND